MLVHVATYLRDLSGQVDHDHYIRMIPNRPGWGVLSRKPRVSKADAKKMAERPMVKKFSEVTKRAAAILKDEALKAEWQQKHLEAMREASRHQRPTGPKGKPAVPERLYDFIRHELSKEL